jgi:hypothetical protein
MIEVSRGRRVGECSSDKSERVGMECPWLPGAGANIDDGTESSAWLHPGRGLSRYVNEARRVVTK